MWAAWAKYQLVIDEMLSPSRVGNTYAQPLFINEKCPSSRDDKGRRLKRCNDNPCPCIQSFFSKMHELLQQSDLEEKSKDDFCNAVLARPGDRRLGLPCERRYAHQRYFGFNLVPLARYGTVEFRVHSATYDAERIARWAQFLVAFVERFGNAPHGNGSMATFFDGNDWLEDFAELGKAQRSATISDLFEELGGMVDARTKQFYMAREWEANDSTCRKERGHSMGHGASLSQLSASVVDSENELSSDLHKLFPEPADKQR